MIFLQQKFVLWGATCSFVDLIELGNFMMSVYEILLTSQILFKANIYNINNIRTSSSFTTRKSEFNHFS